MSAIAEVAAVTTASIWFSWSWVTSAESVTTSSPLAAIAVTQALSRPAGTTTERVAPVAASPSTTACGTWAAGTRTTAAL